MESLFFSAHSYFLINIRHGGGEKLYRIQALIQSNDTACVYGPFISVCISILRLGLHYPTGLIDYIASVLSGKSNLLIVRALIRLLQATVKVDIVLLDACCTLSAIIKKTSDIFSVSID